MGKRPDRGPDRTDDERPHLWGNKLLPPLRLMEKLNDFTSCAITFFLFTTVYIICKDFVQLLHLQKTQFFLNKKTTVVVSLRSLCSLLMGSPYWRGVYINRQHEAPSRRSAGRVSRLGVRMCFYFFRELYVMSSTAAFTVPPRGSWCRQYFWTRSTEL